METGYHNTSMTKTHNLMTLKPTSETFIYLIIWCFMSNQVPLYWLYCERKLEGWRKPGNTVTLHKIL